jgi:hypothetical protein
MESSDSYTAVEKMIERGEIMFSDLERLLLTLRRHERITASEYEALLELAWSMNVDKIRSLFSTNL